MDDITLTWQQGEDLVIPFTYQEGEDEDSLVTIDLSTGYELRMDIVTATTKERVYTFNSADIDDVDPVTVGDTADTVKEATLSNGAGGSPNIVVRVSRLLTLPGGVVYDQMTDSPPVSSFLFDIFLRHVSGDNQFKIGKGEITVEESYTLWP